MNRSANRAANRTGKDLHGFSSVSICRFVQSILMIRGCFIVKIRSRRALVIVDPQNDFCHTDGSLYVSGADKDMERLATHITGEPSAYTDIFVSLDSHDSAAIFHPNFWVDKSSNHPAPYTMITLDDLVSGAWSPVSPANYEFAKRNLHIIKERELGFLMIWPEHCVVSTWGHQISAALMEALAVWRECTGNPVRYIFKGEQPYTDQFSIFEGVDSSWHETEFREYLFEQLCSCYSVTFAGEALSHCVEESVKSFVNRLAGNPHNIRLLVDCTSPVAGFDRDISLRRIDAMGVTLLTSDLKPYSVRQS